jgi:nucleoside-diphosphate-sugar epimerase
MNIGITGASGVLGKIISERIEEKGFTYNAFEGDITEIEAIREWISQNSFDSILHLAAIVPPSEVKNNLTKAFEVNSIATKNVVDILNERSEKPWFFYSSTSHVYKSNAKPISEDDKIEPISEYGLTKYAGEILLKKNYKNFCIGRIFSMYHDTQKPPFLYPNIKRRLQTEDLTKEFELYGADSYRDFLNAEEIADIILKLMERSAIGVYNIASGKGIKIRDFVSNMTDKKLKIKGVGDNDSLVACIDKLNKILNEK